MADGIRKYEPAVADQQEHLSIYRGIIENIGSLIFSVDRQYRYTSFNEAHAQVMKSLFDADIQLGKSILDYHSIPKDRETAKRNIDRALAGEFVKEEGFSGDSQRSRLFFEIFHSPITFDDEIIGVSIIAKDVTDRKRAEDELKEAKETLEDEVARRTEELQRANEQLKRSEYLLKETQAITKVGGWEYDVDTARINWTDEVYLIYGLSPDSYDPNDIEADIGFYAPRDRRKLAEAFVRAVKQGVPYDLEVQFTNARGRQLWVRTMGKAAFREGKVARVSGNIMDVTDRRLLEEQLRHSQKMESVGRLAGGVAHDLNNYLTAVRGYIDLTMADLPGADSSQENLREARASVERATDLTRQLLLFSRREPLELKQLDLNAAVTRLLKMLGSLVGEQYKITTDLDDHVSPVSADEALIEQVLMNLAVNARDAMKGGGEIAISTADISVDGHHAELHAGAYAGEFVRITIQDSGAGMDSRTLSHIFEPFFSTKKSAMGTGLGLSVVYGIVAQHGGWIEVESEPGKGSTFDVFLPASRMVSVEESMSTPESTRRDATGQGERILLVEDEVAVRTVAEKILTLSGYSVTPAFTAEEALNIFQASKQRFDLVFSDVILPGIDGIELAGLLREMEPGLQVVLASGFMEGIDMKAIVNRGYDFLQKPYSRDDLLQLIKRKLSV